MEWRSSARSGGRLHGVEVVCEEWRSSARTGGRLQALLLVCRVLDLSEEFGD